jgi:hypothetical protein
MGRLLSEQKSSPLERSKFSLEEIEAADEAKVPYDGWVKIKDVVMTDKGTCITYESDGPFDSGEEVDDIRDLR